MNPKFGGLLYVVWFWSEMNTISEEAAAYWNLRVHALVAAHHLCHWQRRGSDHTLRYLDSCCESLDDHEIVTNSIDKEVVDLGHLSVYRLS